MNAVHLYDWDDAPHSLREECLGMIPATYSPRWVAWSERQSTSPTYLLAHLSKAYIDAMADNWHKVFIRNVGTGEVRVGCERKRE